APQANIHRCHQADVERLAEIPQEPAAATPDKEYVATRCQLAHELPERLEVALVQAAWAKALKDTRRLLIHLLKLLLGHAQPGGLLLQQLAVINAQPQTLPQRRGKARTSRPQLTGERQDAATGKSAEAGRPH